MLGSEKDLHIILNSLIYFEFFDNQKNVNQKNIINEKYSEYYLLYFWAAWCISCLENIKTMHKMQIPSNIKTIYISVEKDKWIKKSNSLNLLNSYIVKDNPKNKKIINAINLNQIPRYILLDKDLMC